MVDGQRLLAEFDSRWAFCLLHAAEEKTLKMDLMGWVCFDVVPLSWHNKSTDEAQKAKKHLLESLYRTTEVESLPSSKLKDNLYAFFPKPMGVRD